LHCYHQPRFREEERRAEELSLDPGPGQYNIAPLAFPGTPRSYYSYSPPVACASSCRSSNSSPRGVLIPLHADLSKTLPRSLGDSDQLPLSSNEHDVNSGASPCQTRTFILPSNVNDNVDFLVESRATTPLIHLPPLPLVLVAHECRAPPSKGPHLSFIQTKGGLIRGQESTESNSEKCSLVPNIEEFITDAEYEVLTLIETDYRLIFFSIIFAMFFTDRPSTTASWLSFTD
jgi:hypothetical protein